MEQESLVGHHGQDIERIPTQAGSRVTIHLWEDRTRGELWTPVYDPEAVVLLGDDFLRIANGNAVESGRRTFEFQAVAPGEHRIVFEKRLGWKFTAEDRRVFVIDAAGSEQDPTVCLTSGS